MGEKIEKKEKEKKSPIIQENNKDIILNIVIAIVVIIYFVLLILGNKNIEPAIFETDLKVLTMLLLGITILIIEIAYKKDSDKIALIAVEALVISCHTLSIQYIINVFNLDFKNYLLISAGVVAVYYVLKSIIVYTMERKKYLNSLSDISEIIKEEPIKKEATKRKQEEGEEK